MNSAAATLALSELERPRWALRTAAVLLLSVGAGLLLLAVRQAGAGDGLVSALALLAPGWGGLVQAGLGLLRAAHRAPPVALALPWRWMLAGAVGWCLGWALLALSVPKAQAKDEAPSAAADSPLYPPLAAWRDFSPATFAAYAVAILGGEVVLVLLQTFLASGARGLGMAAPSAFVLSLLAAVLVAFAAGAFGAARARRLAAPEATIAVLYLGTPLPVLLTVLPNFPRAALWVGYRFREITYVAELIGRPEIAYWLTFTLLVVALALGILSGFVAGGSGTLDLSTGFELFVAARHVQVFRPRLLFGGLLVLLLGVVPPLLVLAVLRAADAAVERTRIRALGLKDPMLAAAAQRAWAEKAQTATAMMTALSVGGVGVGVMALIIVLSVMSGFEADLQTKILGTNAHVVVLKYTDNGAMPEYAEVVKKVEGLRGVIGVTPFIFGQVMIASEGNVDGTIIKGIDPASVGSVTDLPKNVLPGGNMDWLTQPNSIPVHRPARPRASTDGDDEVVHHTPGGTEQVLPGILLGRELAASLRVLVGDRVTAVSPLGGGMGPTGPMPRSRAFRVAGIFYTGMYEYDSKFAYISLGEAQSFLDVKGATGVELKVADVDDARRIAGRRAPGPGRLPLPHQGLGRDEPQPLLRAAAGEAGDGNHSDHHRDRRRRADCGDGDHAGAREAQGNLRPQGAGRPGRRDREDLPRRGTADWRGRWAAGPFVGPRLVPLHREGGAQAGPAGLLHPLAAGENRAVADGARRGHRHPGDLPGLDLPRAQGLAGGAGRRAEGGIAMALLEVRGVFKSYFLHGKRIDVLRGVSLDIERGELVSLVGASGRGEEHLPARRWARSTPRRRVSCTSTGMSVFELNDARSGALPKPHHRLRLPEPLPAAGVHRAGERRHAGADPAGRPRGGAGAGA